MVNDQFKVLTFSALGLIQNYIDFLPIFFNFIISIMTIIYLYQKISKNKKNDKD